MDRNLISQRQTDALKLEALRVYFDFREGRPTAESVADKLGIPVRTVRDWLADNANGKLLDEIVPLWQKLKQKIDGGSTSGCAASKLWIAENRCRNPVPTLLIVQAVGLWRLIG